MIKTKIKLGIEWTDGRKAPVEEEWVAVVLHGATDAELDAYMESSECEGCIVGRSEEECVDIAYGICGDMPLPDTVWVKTASNSI